MLASHEMERLGCNPIEKMLDGVRELDDLIKLNVDAFKQMRGYSDRQDQGSAYLANAIRATQEKISVYSTLAKFKHPTLSAVAVKDVTDNQANKAPMTTAEAINTLKSDPFAPASLKEIPTERILDAMKTPLNAPFLPSGKSDAKPD